MYEGTLFQRARRNTEHVKAKEIIEIKGGPNNSFEFEDEAGD